jgi:hypothetical protein
MRSHFFDRRLATNGLNRDGKPRLRFGDPELEAHMGGHTA